MQQFSYKLEINLSDQWEDIKEFMTTWLLNGSNCMCLKLSKADAKWYKKEQDSHGILDSVQWFIFSIITLFGYLPFTSTEYCIDNIDRFGLMWHQ